MTDRHFCDFHESVVLQSALELSYYWRIRSRGGEDLLPLVPHALAN